MSRSAATPRATPATEADLLAQPPDGARFELIDGELVEKEASRRHSHGQAQLAAALIPPYGRRRGSDGPGGWRILTEPYVRFGAQVLRPDLGGWHRDRLAGTPDEEVIEVRPDWVCEIVSVGHAGNDLVRKRRLYHQHGVPHYWLLEPRTETLLVLRWTPQGYLEVLAAGRGEVVRAEPFMEVDLAVSSLFWDEE